MTTEAKCPYSHVAGVGRTNRDWWPNRLRLELLHQHSSKSFVHQGFALKKPITPEDVPDILDRYSHSEHLQRARAKWAAKCAQHERGKNKKRARK